MSKLFGGSRSKQTSENQAYGDIKNTFNPLTQYAGQGASAISALLSGDASGFNKYKDATGFDFASEQGSRGITGNAAASGLLRSGSTDKALVNYGQGMQNQYANNYIQQLLGLSGLGFNAGNLIAGAGNKSTATSKSKPGLGGFLGQIGAGIAASDRRLKTNIKKLGEYADGLGRYAFDYIWGGPRVIGVMADEVQRLRPYALGPVIEGYATVDYSKLGR